MVSAWYISLLPVCIVFDSSLHSVLDSLFFFLLAFASLLLWAVVLPKHRVFKIQYTFSELCFLFLLFPASFGRQSTYCVWANWKKVHFPMYNIHTHRLFHSFILIRNVLFPLCRSKSFTKFPNFQQHDTRLHYIYWQICCLHACKCTTIYMRCRAKSKRNFFLDTVIVVVVVRR